MKYKLKRLLSGVLAVALLCSATPVSAFAEESDITVSAIWPEPPKIESEAAVILEASTGAVLYSKSAYDAYAPASTTKLMTSLLAVEQCPLSDIVTCSRASVESIGRDSSHIGLVAGESLDMENALYAILLASANEVSYAVAEHIGGTMENFVDMMNQKAASLGCVNTHFMNPHGLDHEEHYSCPYDLALIAREAIQHTTFRRVSGSYNHKIPETNKNEHRWISNTHPFIKKNVIYNGVFAGKTGHTSKAGNCLVTCAERDGMTLICAIMKAPGSTAVYNDTVTLLDYAFNNFTLTPLTASETISKNAFPVLFEDEEALIADVASPLSVSSASLVLPKDGSSRDLTKEVSLLPITSFSEGENIIGEVSYYYADNYVGSAEIIYHSSEERVVIPSATPSPLPTPVGDTTSESESGTPVNSTDSSEEVSTLGKVAQEETDHRPLIIGILVASIVLIVGLYLVLIEIPHQKRLRRYRRRYGR